jgi:hypothetical protein
LKLAHRIEQLGRWNFTNDQNVEQAVIDEGATSYLLATAGLAAIANDGDNIRTGDLPIRQKEASFIGTEVRCQDCAMSV